LSVRTLLFTGPGGAGTTTLAAAAAIRAARAGRRTVLLSRQAPPVPDLDTVPGLAVVVVDPQAGLDRMWQGAVDALAPVLPALSLPPAGSVLPLPGVPDLALLVELADAEADLVVVDAGALEAAAALLALPTTLRWWLDQLLPPGVRALGAVRTAAVTSGMARRGPVDAALATVPVVEALVARDRLADPTQTAVCLVAQPTGGVPVRLRGAATLLALYGLRTSRVLARTLPDGDGPWWAERATEQAAALAAFADVAPVHVVPEAATAPDGLASVAALLDGFDLPATGGVGPPGGERVEDGWRLTLSLPFAERAAVDLIRWQDDLVVTVGGTRRCVRLDALLRRCQVTGGRLADPGSADARLEVGFRPDPDLWPADLLPAEERTP